MKKREFQELIDKTAEKAKIFLDSFSQLQETEKKLKELKAEIEGVEEKKGLLEEIKSALVDVKEKSEEINSAYNQICEDDEKGTSIQTQLIDIRDKFKDAKEKIDEFEKKVFGYEKEGEDGEIKKIDGLGSSIESFFEKQRERYSVLYKKIETELAAGATSAILSKTFADKVKEYYWAGVLWSGAFIILFGITISYGYDMVVNESSNIKTIDDVWRLLAFRFPLIAFVIWLAIFFGNRRAESKKLEESYKHKEVMARSFTGYKKALQELDDEDEELPKLHMKNLLESMNVNSSDFLNIDGEKHPVMELVSSCFGNRKVKKETTDKEGAM